MSENELPTVRFADSPPLGGWRHRLRGAKGSFWEKYQNQTR